MKKIAIFFTMVIMCLVFAASANAAEIIDSGTCGINGDNVKWTLDSEGVVVISGEGKMAEYDYHAGEYPPFYNDERVVKLIVKDGVTTIAEEMFSRCENLRSVIFEGNLLIMEAAFSDCNSLRFIYARQGFKSKSFVFEGTEGVSKLFIGNNEKLPYRFADEVIYETFFTDGFVYKLIDGKANILGVDPIADFPYEFTLPDKIDGYTISGIEEEALSKSEIKKLIVPDSVTYLAVGAFSDFYTLEEVTLSESITVLPASIFSGCSNLKKVNLPDTITKLGTTIGSLGVESNSGWQFSSCTSLEEIVLPAKIEVLPAYVFYGCKSLKKVVFPDNLTELLFEADLSYNNGNISVKNMRSNLFMNCDSLEKIVLPATLKYIPPKIFNNCKNLTEVRIHGEVTEIMQEAFSNCKSLSFVSIGQGVTKIGENIFSDCNEITDIFYGSSLDDWNKITIADNNINLIAARKHYNTESEQTHPFESVAVKEPDCTNNGIRRCTCECGYEFELVIKAKGHSTNGGEKVIIKEPGCTEYGEKSIICTVCNEDSDIIEIIPALGHDSIREFVPGSMKNDGVDKTTCNRCNETITKRVIPQVKDIKIWDRIICTSDGNQPSVSVLSDGLVEINKENYTVKYSGDGKSAGEFIATITFKGDYEGKTEVKYEILPGAVKNLKATPTKNSVKLTWDKVYGAYGYRVYKYNTKTKKYDVVIKVTTKTSYTVEDLASGTSYELKVVAYGKSKWGAVLSTGGAIVKVKTKLATPKITSVTSSSKGKAVIKWGDISGEVGYQVYYSTSKDGTYKKYGSYKDGKLRATVSGLKSGKKYYFKVRAYDKQNNKTIYSSFSSVKSVKIK